MDDRTLTTARFVVSLAIQAAQKLSVWKGVVGCNFCKGLAEHCGVSGVVEDGS